MELTKHQQKILNGEICPYCKGNALRTSEYAIYGKTFKDRDIIICENYYNGCDSYVGTYEDGASLGRLVNPRLRKYKNLAHKYFDKLWVEELITRDQAYDDLSIFLGLPKELTHIGMMQEKTLIKVQNWSKKYYLKLKEKQISERLKKTEKEPPIHINDEFTTKSPLMEYFLETGIQITGYNYEKSK